jgi:peptidoglycan/LPS O-acetylase OafA/YrhL
MKKHVAALDGLRGIACLVIFAGHYLHQYDHDSHLAPPFLMHAFSQYGSAVDLFFAISGFVIFLSINNLREKLDNTGLFKSYFTSRAFRILPVYFLLILSYYYIPFNNKLMNSDMFISSVPPYVYLFFGQTWWMVANHRIGAPFVLPSWSLCTEVFLYVLLFLIVCFISKKHLVNAMAVVAVISCLIRVLIVSESNNLPAVYYLPISRMDGFMLGGIVALLYTKDRLSWIGTRTLNWILLVCSIGYVTAIVNIAMYGKYSDAFIYTFYALFFSAVIIRTTKSDISWLSKGPLAYMGTVSYFVYLFHVPIIFGMSYIKCNIVLNLVLTFGVMMIMATISWYGMEKPLIDRGKSLNAIPALGSVHRGGCCRNGS